MSKYARKVDASQPEIVKALRKAGYTVCIIGQPVDLAIRHHAWKAGMFMLMEAKTPTATGKRRARRDQEAQEAFCREHGVTYALTPEQALEAVGATGMPDGWSVGVL